METMDVCGHVVTETQRKSHSKRNTLRLERCLDELSVENDTSEVKSGELFLVHTFQKQTRKIPVFVRVYRTSFEHYAVFYQNKKFCRASTYINLKHCNVQSDIDNPTLIRITTDDAEGNVVIFQTERLPVGDWLEAFQEKYPLSPKKGTISPKLSPMIPRSPVMQTLHETDEEE